MARMFGDRMVISIDVGTTKICVLVAQCLGGERLEIVGVGKAPSMGLRKGVVVDVGQAVRSIRQAVKEAELMAGITIDSAYVGISGGHITSVNSHGVVPVKRGQIDQGDVERALAAARAVPIEQDYQILHVLPQYFVIDARDKVTTPVGMHGIRLEVQAHLIMGAVASVQNLVHCCQMAGVKVKDIVLEQLASADAVLSQDERELGVAVLDIGGGTSDLALYQHGSIRHTMVLPVAGNHFTNDVAIGLRTTLGDAERIKKECGSVHMDALAIEELVEIEMVQGTDRQLVRVRDLVAILQPRAHELLRLVHQEITTKQLLSFMPAGLVLTGGGSLLRGMDYSAQSFFLDFPIRVGNPRIDFEAPHSLRSPMYATGYGLLVHALKKQNSVFGAAHGPVYKRVFESMKSWVADFF